MKIASSERDKKQRKGVAMFYIETWQPRLLKNQLFILFL